MSNNSLEIISQTLLMYIGVKFPQLTHWKVDSLSILVFDLYSNILRDLAELDKGTLLVRHYLEKSLGKSSKIDDDDPNVILSIERIDDRNEFVLSCKGDLVTSWYEFDEVEMN